MCIYTTTVCDCCGFVGLCEVSPDSVMCEACIDIVAEMHRDDFCIETEEWEDEREWEIDEEFEDDLGELEFADELDFDMSGELDE